MTSRNHVQGNLRLVHNWKDDEIIEKEVKSCDNQGLGDSKQVEGDYLVVRKGMRTTRIPRDAVASYDGDKIYLRVTEAEALAGVYPFLSEGNYLSEEQKMKTDTQTPSV
jgi:hypothetical protein